MFIKNSRGGRGFDFSIGYKIGQKRTNTLLFEDSGQLYLAVRWHCVCGVWRMASETVEVNFGAGLSAKKGDSLLMFPMPPPAELRAGAESCGLWFGTVDWKSSDAGVCG